MALRPSAYRDGTVGVTGNRATPPDAVPSIVVAGEQYNVLARLAAEGRPVSLRVELRTRYFEDDRNSYNVIAEIPGHDPALRDEVVLIGAHLDSWHTASGATDNADGAVAGHGGDAHHPRARRRAAAHDPGGAVERRGAGPARRACLRRAALQHAGGARSAGRLSERRSRKRQDARLLHGREYAQRRRSSIAGSRRCATSARRGTSSRGIGSTDHVPFNEAGLPGFNAIKDFDAYDERTRHTNADYPERMSEDELKQSAIVMATFAWQAAMADEKIPRQTTRVALSWTRLRETSCLWWSRSDRWRRNRWPLGRPGVRKGWMDDPHLRAVALSA